jgi:primase-like protein/DNA primase RepB-like protein/uncharacterized protein DUF5906
MRKGQSQAKASPSSGERATAHPLDMPEVEHFLTLLDGDADTFIFARGDDDKERRKRLIAEAKQSGRPPPGLWEHRRGSHVSTQPWLQEKQPYGWGVFVAVQAMRGGKCRVSDLAYIRCVFAEMDIGDPLEPWPLEPSLIVESSPGKYHVYWLVLPEDPINADEFSGIEMRLIETYGSDPDAKDLARRLRLPGSWNVKPGRPPHLVRLIHEAGARYSKAELLKAFPPPRKRKATSTKKRPLMGQPSRGLDRFVGQHQDGPLWSISPDLYGDWLRVGMALHAETSGSAEGQGLWDAWSARSEKWAPGVCADRWKSFSGGRGVTGGTVFAMAKERGWVPAIRRAPDVAQRIDARAQDRGRRRPAQTEASATLESPLCEMRDKDLTTDDFYGDMESGEFICIDTLALWPATTVNARVPPIKTGETDEKTGKPKTMKASAWIAKHRPVDQMSWIPGKPMVIENTVVAEGGLIEVPRRTVFNLYRPPIIKHGDAEQAGKWLDHIKLVYPSEHGHIINWFGHRVQRAFEKVNHAIVLGGSPGIGKDTILKPVRHAIGSWNMKEVQPAELLGQFTGHVKAVLLRVSEARDMGDGEKSDRFALYEHTKTLLAAPPEVLVVSEKHVNKYAVPNLVGVVFTTNHRTDGLYLPPNDRRHYVAWSEMTKEDFGNEYWNDIHDWLDNKGGNGHVAAYLATLDLADFSATAPPPQTDAFWAMVHAGRTSEDIELADVIDALGNPPALYLGAIQARADSVAPSLADYLRNQQQSSRRMPFRLEKAGYLSINSDRKDGCWWWNSKRHVVYAHRSLSLTDRKAAAQALADCNGDIAALVSWAKARGLCVSGGSAAP